MTPHRDVSTVLSRATVGLDAPLVRVEVHLGPGLPAFFLVGLPATVVRESRERVRSALLTAGFSFPPGRITVNLSPADLPKEGGRFDLPIAVGILAASGQLRSSALVGREFYGELALSGELRETPQLLPALLAGSRTAAEVILPAANAVEAGLVAGPRIRLAQRLADVCVALDGGTPLPAATSDGPLPAPRPAADLADVRGQYAAKRAVEIAAAGCHALLLIGPPGAGKTLLAQRLPGLLPALDEREALQVACLQSTAGQRPTLGRTRPFRSPQHTATAAALTGGAALRPGELALAHLGVLFLDELPEFSRNVLEALREPLETGRVHVARAKRTIEFPARFQLVAAMNPCPCGYAGDARCGCTAREVARYRHRVSGPLLDRIDLHVMMAALPPEQLLDPAAVCAESSAVVAARVARAQGIQLERQGKLNSRLTPADVATLCDLPRDARALLHTAIARLGLSARAYHRVLKLARTCADLGGDARIGASHVSEALQLRALDRAVTC